MRAAVLILLIVLAAPAMARDLGWAPYENTRFGYTIDIPPNFTGRGESDNGDGQIYVRRDRGQGLTVWGGHVLEDFETSAIEAMQLTQRDRWNASYQAITPGWAVLQAANGLRRLHLRLVATCDATQYAAFALTYSVGDIDDVEPMIADLEASLRGTGDCGN